MTLKLKRIYPNALSDSKVLKFREEIDGENIYDVSINGNKQGIYVEETDDYISADLSFLKAGTGAGGKVYDELFEVSSKAGKKFKTDSLEGHNIYRFYINVMKRKLQGKDVSHIMKPSSDETISDSFLSSRAKTILSEHSSGEKVRGDSMKLSKGNIQMLKHFAKQD